MSIETAAIIILGAFIAYLAIHLAITRERVRRCERDIEFHRDLPNHGNVWRVTTTVDDISYDNGNVKIKLNNHIKAETARKKKP